MSDTWVIILALGAATYLIRLSFLGLIGGRTLPPWLMRHLRYTPVAVLPGLVAPLVLWPPATGGEPDLARLIAAVLTVVVGWRTGSVLAALLAGLAGLYAGLAVGAMI